MQSTTYDKTEISKEIGLKQELRKLPPMNQVRESLEAARKGDRSAAVRLFTWYRFCKSARTSSEVDVSVVLMDAFKELFV